MRKHIGIVCFFLLFGWGNALAGQLYLGPALGYDALTGDAGRLSDDGAAYGFFAGYRLNETAAVEVNTHFSSHDDVTDEKGASTLDVWSFLIGPTVSFPWRGVSLYTSAGLGVYLMDYRFDPESTGLSARKDNDSESGIFVGVGVDVPVSRTLFLGFDVKYQHIFSDNVLDGDMIGTRVRVGFSGF